MSKVSEIVKGVLALAPEAPAINSGDDWYTWADISAIVEQVEAELDKRGFGEGTRVGVLLRTRPNFFACVAAVLSSGRCLVTLNPVYPDDRVADDIFEQASPVLVLTGADYDRPLVREAAAKIGALVLRLPDRVGEPVAVLQEYSPSDDIRASNPGVAIEMFTSGTTGKPKRVPLKRDQFEGGLLRNFEFERGRSTDEPVRLRNGVQIITAPLAHISGILSMMNCLLAGRQACLIDKFNVPEVHKAVVNHRPRVLSLPPAALKMVYDADLPREDFSSIKVFRTGTAPLDPALADAVFEKFGIPVLQNYGATEFGGVAGWTLDDFQKYRETRRGSVGRLNNGVEGRVVDPETFEPVPFGETGLLELKSKDIGDGKSWLRTSDLASLDEENFLWIRGRADNAIIRGGFKIHPDRVTKALESHPSVREACVVGLKDDRLGQVPGAAYTLWNDAEVPTHESLVAFLKDSLAPYEVPIVLRRVEDFPRTVSLKVDQRALAEQLLA